MTLKFPQGYLTLEIFPDAGLEKEKWPLATEMPTAFSSRKQTDILVSARLDILVLDLMETAETIVWTFAKMRVSV